jgi:hypothetical protein
MGCSQSELVNNTTEIDTSKFTLDEIDAIRSSWKLIEDKKEFGMCMMIK